MPITVTCECGKQLQAKDEYAGRRTQCPNCGRELVIPAAAPALGPNLAGPSFEPGPPKMPPLGEVRTSGKAIASLVLGLVAFGCCVMSVPGLVLGILGLNEANRSAGRVRGQGLAIAGIVLSCLSVIICFPVNIALLLPAVQQSREAARRMQCTNNLKQIGLAMHNFHDATNAFPAQAITDANGKPLLSWRVAILPYIEQKALFDEFHLDEPWDSPHNLALLPRMPSTYSCPSDLKSTPSSGMTPYQAFVGPGAMMDPARVTPMPGGPALGVNLASVTDGTSNTVLVAESSNPVEWTKPDDLVFIPKGPQPPVGSVHIRGFNALFTDGSVRFLRMPLGPQMIEAFITRNGGEALGPPGD